jgi:tRNA(Ile)-lysidine synthase
MTNRFEDTVKTAMTTLCGVPPGGRVVVALSGGADSVALLSALTASGYDCVAANCNFNLRGAESDRDTAYSLELARSLGAETRTVSFDVEARRRATGESVEMACRSLRYEWFETVRCETGAVAIAVGHHRDDNVETMLLNLTRRTGIAGLAGMRYRAGRVVRPMLELTREEVVRYLRERGLSWVEDSTNSENEYRRNRLRNVVLPTLERELPGAVAAMAASAANISEDRNLLDTLVEMCALPYADRYEHGATIDVAGMAEKFGATTKPLLFKLLTPYSFNRTITDNIVDAVLSGNSGGTFSDGEYTAYLDRGTLTVTDQPADDTSATYTFRLVDGCEHPICLRVELHDISDFSPRRDPRTIYLDADAISADHEMTLRHPRTGDRISPYGMRGKRLLSDIFNDAKTPTLSRREAWVLTDGTNVLWLVGMRASRHYAVTGKTRRYLQITVI